MTTDEHKLNADESHRLEIAFEQQLNESLYRQGVISEAMYKAALRTFDCDENNVERN